MEKFSVQYEPDFTEQIYNQLITYCKNIQGGRNALWRGFTDDSFESFKKNKYFNFDSSAIGKNKQYYAGVDNNPQHCKVINLFRLIEILHPVYEIY